MSTDPRKVMKNLKSEIDGDLGSFFNELERNLRLETPVDEGRARRGWRKTGNPSVDSHGNQPVIENRVPYIGVLDKGSSKQAPNGIVEPAFKKTARKRNT